MRTSMNLVAAACLVLMLVMATEMNPVMVAEAKVRTCESASHKFKGSCLSKSNCGNVCKSEGFPSGHCRGLRRRCFCVKPC